MLSILQREIATLQIEQSYKQAMLDPLLKITRSNSANLHQFFDSNAQEKKENQNHMNLGIIMKNRDKTIINSNNKLDKVSVLLKVGFKYIKLLTKVLEVKKFEQASVILEFIQKSMSQIYQSQESYLWWLLKIRVIISRLQYAAIVHENGEKRDSATNSNSSSSKYREKEKDFQDSINVIGEKKQEKKLKASKKQGKSSEKLGFKNRIHLFCEQIVQSQHCKEIQSDFYSQVEIIYYYGIQSLLRKIERKKNELNLLEKQKKNRKATSITSKSFKQKGRELSLTKERQFQPESMNQKVNKPQQDDDDSLGKDFLIVKELIVRCRNCLKIQIQRLCESLAYEEKKVFQIIERKCQFFLKIYAIQLLYIQKVEGSFSKKSQQKLWKIFYHSILFKVPNKISPDSINTLIAQITKKERSKSKSQSPKQTNSEKKLNTKRNLTKQIKENSHEHSEGYSEDILKKFDSYLNSMHNFSDQNLSDQSGSQKESHKSSSQLQRKASESSSKMTEQASQNQKRAVSILKTNSDQNRIDESKRKRTSIYTTNQGFGAVKQRFSIKLPQIPEEKVKKIKKITYQHENLHSVQKSENSDSFNEEDDQFSSQELNTEKRLCLQRLMNSSKGMKPRYDKKNRFLSIQYRPSLVASTNNLEREENRTQIYLKSDQNNLQQIAYTTSEKSDISLKSQNNTNKSEGQQKSNQKQKNSSIGTRVPQQSKIFHIAIRRSLEIHREKEGNKSFLRNRKENNIKISNYNPKLSKIFESVEKRTQNTKRKPFKTQPSKIQQINNRTTIRYNLNFKDGANSKAQNQNLMQKSKSLSSHNKLTKINRENDFNKGIKKISPFKGVTFLLPGLINNKFLIEKKKPLKL